MKSKFARRAARKLLTCLLMLTGVCAAASDGLWESHFWGQRKCDVLGHLKQDGRYFAIGFSWDTAKGAVGFQVAEMNGADRPMAISVASPSLTAPLPIESSLTESRFGAEVDAFRADLARGSAWQLVAKPHRRDAVTIEAPPSNARTQLAMFDACVAASARHPDIDSGPASPGGHWSAGAEVSSCSLAGRFALERSSLQVVLLAGRGDLSVYVALAEPASAGIQAIDITQLGGGKVDAAKAASVAIAAPAQEGVVARLAGGNDAAILLIDASGAQRKLALVAPQDAVDVAMFAGCVNALR